MKGSLALSMEDTNSRMVRLGRHELTGVDHLSLDEAVARHRGGEPRRGARGGQGVFSGPFVLGGVGPFDATDLERFVT
jgi:hypothetical protein